MTLVTPSHWLAGLVKESFLKEYPVEVVHNKINLDVFKPTPSDFRSKNGLDDKIIVLGVASVWERRKGLDDFVELAGLLDERYQIVLVGVTPEQAQKLPDSIMTIARTNSPQALAEIYSSADYFVNPTYEENYPTVNLEARACGTRIICYDSGGSSETMGPEDVLIKTKCAESLAAALTAQ